MVTVNQRYSITQAAEWDQAELVLVSEPSTAVFFGTLTPYAVNFKGPFSLHRAQEEHRCFQKRLKASGIEVIEVRDIFKNLKKREDHLNIMAAAEEILNQGGKKGSPLTKEILQQLAPVDLLQLLLLHPEITLQTSRHILDETTRYTAQYRIHPATNHYFLRDPLMTTKKGVILLSLQLEARRMERKIIQLLLDILGIEPIYQIQPPGRVEGGDFLPAGDYVLQGQGLLTNEEGVQQLLKAGAYDQVEVAVVRDPAPSMEAMHLDTYFNFLSPDLAVIQRERLTGPQRPEVDIYWPKEGEGSFYDYVGSMSFPQYLTEKGVECIPFSAAEQARFAPNYLLLSRKNLIGVKGAGESFFHRLKACGVQVEPLDFSSLTNGYGGPHCMSQVLSRRPEDG